MNPLTELIGDSRALAEIRAQAAQLLGRRFGGRRLPPLLIQGETGTGKGLLARAIHRASSRGSGPFVAVNCAAIPETLLEAELFGYERGAFTDAKQGKAGLFQVANHGTLFLDEIGLLPEALQAKLLTALEDRSVRRLGGTQSEPVDVWIIAATNDDLEGAIASRRFREDLYYRLAVLPMRLPPLRERGEDVLPLAEHFLARACADYGLPPRTLGEDARAALVAYPWPGNIRELSNVMERAALLARGTVIGAAALGLPGPRRVERARAPFADAEAGLDGAYGMVASDGDSDQEQVARALHESRGNISRAAMRLGISRNALRYRMEKHQLQSLAPRSADAAPHEPPRLALQVTRAASPVSAA
jgi:transcriptional regulator with PAS, ATPase and Fis domain